MMRPPVVTAPSTWPTVSVIMPVRNEAAHLARAVEAVLEQHYPGTLELILSVAPSHDGTEQLVQKLAASDRRIVTVANSAAKTPNALNRAIEAASGSVIARVDAHAQLSEGYLRLAVEILQQTGAANVGGVQHAVGGTPMQQAIAAAMSSRFGTGDAKFHYGGSPGPTDTVYLGVFRRAIFDQVGMFDESLERNQDYELNIRIRKAGEEVWFDPRLQVIYWPRTSLLALARQYHDYGRWKRVVIKRHARSVRWRQLVPPAAVVANAGGIVGMLVRPWFGLVPAAYGVAVIAAAVATGRDDGLAVTARLTGVFAVMHHAWGFGFLRGIDGRRPVDTVGSGRWL